MSNLELLGVGGFVAAGGGGVSWTLVQHKSFDNNATASSATVTGLTATTAGDNIAICAVNTTNTSNISGASDNASGGTNTYTVRATSLATHTAGIMSECADSLATARGGVTSVTVNFSASAGYVGLEVFVFRRSTGTATFDVGAATTNGTGVGTDLTGPSISVAGNPGAIFALCVPGNNVSVNPKAGNEFTSGGDLFSFGPAAASLVTASTGSHVPVWTDSGSGDVFTVSAVAYK